MTKKWQINNKKNDEINNKIKELQEKYKLS